MSFLCGIDFLNLWSPDETLGPWVFWTHLWWCDVAPNEQRYICDIHEELTWRLDLHCCFSATLFDLLAPFGYLQYPSPTQLDFKPQICWSTEMPTWIMGVYSTRPLNLVPTLYRVQGEKRRRWKIPQAFEVFLLPRFSRLSFVRFFESFQKIDQKQICFWGWGISDECHFGSHLWATLTSRGEWMLHENTTSGEWGPSLCESPWHHPFQAGPFRDFSWSKNGAAVFHWSLWGRVRYVMRRGTPYWYFTQDGHPQDDSQGALELQYPPQDPGSRMQIKV